MTVSVLLPVHGACPYLAEALRSLTEQTEQGFTLVAVMDRPSPSARAVVASWARPTDAVIESTRPGVAAALNAGLAQVQTDWVARLDADDVCLPWRLRTCLDEVRSDPQLVAVSGGAELIDESGAHIGFRGGGHGSEHLVRRLRWRSPMIHPSVMFSTEAVTAVAGYREVPYVEDYDLWLRLAAAGGALAVLPTVLIKYRCHQGQTTKAAKFPPDAEAAVLTAREALAVSRGESVQVARARHRVWSFWNRHVRR